MVGFVLDQHHEHALLGFYSANSLKQQSADRHVAPLGNILIPMGSNCKCKKSFSCKTFCDLLHTYGFEIKAKRLHNFRAKIQLHLYMKLIVIDVEYQGQNRSLPYMCGELYDLNKQKDTLLFYKDNVNLPLLLIRSMRGYIFVQK